MQRYFVPAQQMKADVVHITGDDAHHLTRVMRAKPGDEVIAANGADREVLVRIREIEKEAVVADIVEERPLSGESPVTVWIAQSLPKGDKMETVIQKGTEVGAARFLPFLSERTVVQYDARKEAKRLDRWRKIAKEAAEQAHRSRIPEVEAPLSWKELLALAGQADLALLCYEKEEGRSFKEWLRAQFAPPAGPAQTVLVVIGPEGGFTEREAEEAQAAGCRTVSLGSRILRTETAALVALTCIMYETGEMGG
ncbi:ribosomal RNA small subunit methyltransferase E [Paenibacillus sp. J31TS4]|uniref:16S rRNA (uracil(1498)-N(3))-methyltransferase n=1 Tax=Paenibacillus sp. J31TS4 TaxID=2807195 RepID=UPI001B1314A1|nr:16S rRNA (uracil(1498)-N(3))-methyltransferase [Paenibacillus sp. J31TS4]GIP39590.1 ribosomal RNA small subunit methyltransferase E [Paenibacillus sp. J31TS4]